MSAADHAPSPLAADAVAGVTSPALAAVLADSWDWTMRWAPTFATTLGDHRFDDRLAPRDETSLATMRRERIAQLDRARAIDPITLEPADRLTWSLFLGAQGAAAAVEGCRLEEWTVSAQSSPLDELSYLAESHLVRTADDARNLLARFAAAPRMLDEIIAGLRRGKKRRRVAPAESIRRAIAQLDAELAKPVDDWAMTAPAREPDRPAWFVDFGRELRAIVDAQVRPALIRYRDLLRDELLPHGRVGAHEGVGGLHGGDAIYQAMILTHLGEPRAPQELHDLGKRCVAASDAAIAALGASLFGAPDLAATIAHLRADRGLRFSTGAEIVALAEAQLARARAAMPRCFRTLPRTDCVVAEIPAHEAPFTTVAYYRQPHYDGSKPGEYFVNTYRPETRPRYEFEALTWHESIPGHHLQIAIAQELGATPLFRKLDGSTAYIEGWALYTERLAEELGLYTGDLDRLGMHSFDAWRASRLVVDTGLHALGWTRAEAEAYLAAHTALTPENIANEVDRYINWPGQALAYKVGQLAILDLRAEAERALGDRFDLPGFHDVVLCGGAVTLPILAMNVRGWIASLGGAVADAHDHDHHHHDHDHA